MAELWEKTDSTPHRLVVQDPEKWYDADVRSDGCIDFTRYFNFPLDWPERDEDDVDCYIHICDIDDFIARLKALKQMAIEHFGDSWAA